MKKLFLVATLTACLPSLILAQANATINWQKWEQASFNRAIEQNKMIFVDVGTEWCTACNWMEEDTYTDAQVIKLLNQNFVCIKVDAEAQPDVGERYLDWGWPALIFMNPRGEQVQAIQGNRQPPRFIPILENLIAKFKAGKLEPEAQEAEAADAAAQGIDSVYAYALYRLNIFYDELYGGWVTRNGIKMPLYAPVEFSMWESRVDAEATERARLTLTNTLNITDPVWGGVYFGSESNDWKSGMPEKRTEQQAGALLNFSEMYLATGDKKWLGEANHIKSYLNTFIRSPKGLYYNSQEENISPAGNPDGISSHDYFALGDAARRKIGVPPVDKTIHTDINTKLIRAWLSLYQGSQESNDLETAVNMMNLLNEYARNENGAYRQVVMNENEQSARIRTLHNDKNEVIYLRTQAYSGLALLSLYYNTGDSTWLKQAKQLGQVVKKELWDEKQNAFSASNAPDVMLAGKSTRTYPLMDNAVTARFFTELSALSRTPELRRLAKTALVSIGKKSIIDYQERLLGEYLLALDKVKKGHLEFTVVDAAVNTNSDLYNLVRAYYHPAKITKLEKPGHYPDFEKPVLFICTDNLCSQPIEFNADTKTEIDKFIQKVKR